MKSAVKGKSCYIFFQMPVLKMKETDTIYDYCWFPKMSSANPETAWLVLILFLHTLRQ